MRWVFVRPYNYSPCYDPERQEPLGIEYLAAVRRARADQVLILDADLHALSETKLARRAASFQPDVIGLTLTTAQEIESARNIYAECKRALAGRAVRWLAGGNFISTEPQHARRLLPEAFTLVRFEGEEALERLAAAWRTTNAVPAERCYEGQPVRDLDRLPFPDRPFARQILNNGWAFNLQGSRGCCGQCRYCAAPGRSGNAAAAWRGRSPAHLVDEIEYLFHRFGATSFNFTDEDFLGPVAQAAARVREFAADISARRLSITFGVQVRPTTLTPEIVELLSTAGLVYVFMGIESDDPDDFRRWGRAWTDDPWQFVRLFRQHGVEVNAGTLLFHPHATLRGIRRFATTLNEHGLLNYRTAASRVQAMPNSVFYTEALKNRQIEPGRPGPQSLLFHDPAIEHLYTALRTALDPLGPPFIHAVCQLPPLASRRHQHPDDASAYHCLKEILHDFDTAVADTLFALLDAGDRQNIADDLVRRLYQCNLRFALEGARALNASGFAASFEMLRDAIRAEAELL